MEFGITLKQIQVMNLATGESQEIRADSPAGAVVLAGLTAQGIYQDSLEFIAKFVEAWRDLSWGSKTVAFGDFAALL